MKKILLYSLLSIQISVLAQVGVGTTTPRGALDINSSTQGVVVPTVSLVDVLTQTAVNPQGGAIPAGTIVYNDATSGASPNNVGPGLYFWNGARWVAFAGSPGGLDWSLTGNTGTAPATNFIGTTDNVELRFRTNNTERLRIGNTGNIGVNIAPSTYKLDVSSGTGDAIYGHSANVGGVIGYETNFSFGIPAQNLNGSGLYANNPAAGYTSIFAQSTGAATVAANIAYSNVWMATYNYVDNASATFNPSTSYNQLNITNATLAGTQIALRGFNNRAATAGNPGYSVGVQGYANSQNQDSYGVQGLSYSNAPISTGGYFSGNNYTGTNIAYAYIGGWTNGVTTRKITGTGTVSEIIPTEEHGRVTLTCPESPEYWYQDYGTVEMVNGKAIIHLDQILADIIVVNEENPIRVACTPVGMPYFNGITIMSQTSNSVEILELNGGNHSGKLQYQLVVKPKTNYGEGRFPQAPGPAYLKSDKEPLAAKAKNQPLDGRKIYQWPSDHIVYKYNPENYIKVGDIVPAGPNAGKIFLGEGKYSDGIPAENPALKKKKNN